MPILNKIHFSFFFQSLYVSIFILCWWSDFACFVWYPQQSQSSNSAWYNHVHLQIISKQSISRILIYQIWAHKTSLTPSLFFYWSVWTKSTKVNGHVYVNRFCLFLLFFYFILKMCGQCCIFCFVLRLIANAKHTFRSCICALGVRGHVFVC